MALFNKDIGIDLGTANVVVYLRNKGIVIREPSVVAMNMDNNKVLAVGSAARDMIGRTPGNVTAVRPIRDGVIAKFAVTQQMLKHFIGKITKGTVFVKPRIVICAPVGVTEVEKRAIEEASKKAGAREAYIIEEPMAASIGAGLPVEEPIGSMIVDIGGGTTEVAVISFGGIVASRSIKVAGDELDSCIVQFIKKKYNLMVGERTAEEIKMNIATAFPGEMDESMEIRGRDMVTGLPNTVVITSAEVNVAITEPVNAIVDAVKYTLEKTPPELAADVIEYGITLAGGGALLKGLDKVIRHETGIDVHIADEPLDCVARGTGKVIDDFDELQKVLLQVKQGY